MNLLDEGHHLIAELEHGIHRFRSHVAQHTWTNIAMELLDDLITSGQKLKVERADLVTDRDNWKDQAHAEHIRADAAESALKALQDETSADEAKVKAALDEMNAEVEAEAGNVFGQAGQGSTDGTIITNVTAPTTTGQTVLPISQVSAHSIADAAGSAQTFGGSVTISGPAIADGTTVISAEPTAATITLSSPTTAAHVGDGREVLTIAAPVSSGASTPTAALELPAAS